MYRRGKARPEEWAVIQADLAEWKHPITGKYRKFLFFQDQGCRLLKAACLFEMGGRRNITSKELYEIYLEHWEQCYGRPKIIKVDAEGAWRSQENREKLESTGIELQIVPGQAPGKWGASREPSRW